jgi:hypothetical protein
MQHQPAYPLLRTVMPDGVTYLFVIEADETWTIRRDGQVVSEGPGDERGVGRGTRLFCRLTQAQVRIAPFPPMKSLPPGTATPPPPGDAPPQRYTGL